MTRAKKTVSRNATASRKTTTRRSAASTGRRSRTTAGRSRTTAVSAAGLEERIRERAYYIYLERRGAAGDPVADWLQAEREIRQTPAPHD